MEIKYYLYVGLALASLLIVLTKRQRCAAHGLRLPPGPWQLPLIGSLLHIAGQLPHRAMRDLASRHGSVMLLRIGEVPMVVVSSREGAREVMKARTTWCSRRGRSAPPCACSPTAAGTSSSRRTAITGDSSGRSAPSSSSARAASSPFAPSGRMR
jgi:hypothetical protein